MKYTQILFLMMFCLSCSSNRQPDPNVIEKELQISDNYFIGKRSLDDKANIYTMKIESHIFYTDTIRLYALNNWQNIEYWDGDGGYLLFKDLNGDDDGLKIKISEMNNLNDNYLIIQEKQIVARKEEEQKKKEELERSYSNSSSTSSYSSSNSNSVLCSECSKPCGDYFYYSIMCNLMNVPSIRADKYPGHYCSTRCLDDMQKRQHLCDYQNN